MIGLFFAINNPLSSRYINTSEWKTKILDSKWNLQVDLYKDNTVVHIALDLDLQKHQTSFNIGFGFFGHRVSVCVFSSGTHQPN